RDEARAIRRGVTDRGRGRLDIGPDLIARTHLDECDPHHRASPSSLSSLPERLSETRSSQPPTWVSPMKTCGTVRRPPARAVISLRSSVLPPTSISRKLTPLLFRISLALTQ